MLRRVDGSEVVLGVGALKSECIARALCCVSGVRWLV